jgi:archaellum component FlaC
VNKHKFKTIEWENMEWVLLQDVLLFKKEMEDELGKWVAHTTQQDDLIEKQESQLETKDAEIERLKEGIKEVVDRYPNMSRGVRKDKLKALLEKDKE